MAKGRASKAVATTAIDKKQEHQIKNIVKKLNQLEPETKWAEYTNSGLSCDYSGSLVSLSVGIAQGVADYGNRIGDEITMKRLKIRLQPYWGYVIPTIYRVLVFQYLKDPDGATSSASILNLFLHSTQMGTIQAPSAPYDHDNRTSFKVLYDKVHVIETATLTSGNTNPGQSRFHKIDISFEKSRTKKIKYFANGTTTTQNEIFMAILNDSASPIVVPYVAHVYYTDS